ncbi:MAG: hypothetical protein IKB97_05230 [Bacteroidaceae bacterium]|nr:hypothetical protein [Bacteroidaceae bacterium]
MNIWLVLGWDTVDGNWEVAKVLFDEAAIQPAVAELFAECSNYDELLVECWHRDDADDWDASYYETEFFYREEDE